MQIQMQIPLAMNEFELKRKKRVKYRPSLHQLYGLFYCFSF